MHERSFKCCPHTFFRQLVQWLGDRWQDLDPLTLLSSCRRLDKYGKYYWLAAWGIDAHFSKNNRLILPENFGDGKDMFDSNQWLFGRINYDAFKRYDAIDRVLSGDNQEIIVSEENNVCNESQENGLNNLGFSKQSSFLYCPQYVLYAPRNKNCITIRGTKPERIFHAIQSVGFPKKRSPILESFLLTGPQPLWDYTTYADRFYAVQQHLKSGNIYEMNLTQPFHAAINATGFNPLLFFDQQTSINPVPMAALHREGNDCALSFSPERFLSLDKHRLVSQPIKGTIQRSTAPIVDQWRKAQLKAEKYRAENVMIVDLVRNDLNRCCKTNSVQVPKLFEVHTFKRLHHLISTIIGIPQSDQSLNQILESVFPAGSMTGAPKLRAMQIIDEVEDYSRQLYSGSIGYIDPTGNFDLNVVIRTMILNLETGIITYPAGGAITVDSSLESEYKEMCLKVNQVFKPML